MAFCLLIITQESNQPLFHSRLIVSSRTPIILLKSIKVFIFRDVDLFFFSFSLWLSNFIGLCYDWKNSCFNYSDPCSHSSILICHDKFLIFFLSDINILLISSLHGLSSYIIELEKNIF